MHHATWTLMYVLSLPQIRCQFYENRLNPQLPEHWLPHTRPLMFNKWMNSFLLNVGFQNTNDLIQSPDSFFFNFILFLTLQYCIGFAKYRNESATGIHVFPILNPPPSSLPIPSLWVLPVHQPQASSIVHRTWTGNSFHIWYYTYFNAILPNHPTLSLSHRVQKTVLYISVSFAVSYTGLLLPSF